MSVAISYPDRDPAFREHASGLIVPAELSREREVWSKDEYRTLERATRLLTSRGVSLFMGCDDPKCKNTPIERLRNPDGGITLRCFHKDRVVVKL